MKKLEITKQYSSYDEIPSAKKAWVTINAKKEGKNPVMVHAGLKAAFTRKSTDNINEYIKIAAKLAKANKRILPSKKWLKRNGYQGLLKAIDRHPEKFV